MPRSEIVFTNNKIYHLGLSQDQLAPNILLVGDPARAYKVAEYFKALTHEVKHREFVTITGNYKGLEVTVIGTGIGTDNVEIAIVEAYNLLCFDLQKAILKNDPPSMRIIRVGTSGGIQDQIAAGTMAISQYALGLDSTGLYYDHPPADATVLDIENASQKILTKSMVPGARFKNKIHTYASKATPLVVQTMTRIAMDLKIPFVKGITVSSPGFYGPSGRYIEGFRNTIPGIKSKLAKLKSAGLHAVNMEMESSLIFHLCGHLGIACGAVCPIISNPLSSTDIVDYDLLIDQAIQIGLNTLADLARS